MTLLVDGTGRGLPPFHSLRVQTQYWAKEAHFPTCRKLMPPTRATFGSLGSLSHPLTFTVCRKGLDPLGQPHPRGLNKHLAAECFEIFQMKRAVSGSGVITIRVVATAITLDDQGIQQPLYPKGAPGSCKDDLALPALNSDVVSAKFLLMFAILSPQVALQRFSIF